MIRHLCAALALGLLASFASADAIITSVTPNGFAVGTTSTTFLAPGPALGTTSSISGAGGVSINGRNQRALGALSAIGIQFTLFTPHAYAFVGNVAAFAEIGTAIAEVGLAAPPSTLIEGPFAPTNASISFNESGILGPGTYFIGAHAVVQGELTNQQLYDGFAEAGFRFNLTLRDIGRQPRPPIPEPASLALFGLGGFAVWLRRRRQN